MLRCLVLTLLPTALERIRPARAAPVQAALSAPPHAWRLRRLAFPRRHGPGRCRRVPAEDGRSPYDQLPPVDAIPRRASQPVARVRRLRTAERETASAGGST